MRGDVVIGRLHRGRAKLFVVWLEREDAVEVTTPEIYEQASADGAEPVTIGLPRKDVFAASAAYKEFSEDASLDWSRLTPYVTVSAESQSQGAP